MIKRECLLVAIIVLMFCGAAHSVNYDNDSGKLYGGYAVVFNAETGEGFVYANQVRNSLLFVFYPTKNAVYIYSKEGQGIYFADDIKEFILKFGVSQGNLISTIRPFK